LRQNYGKAPHAHTLMPQLEAALESPGSHLGPLNVGLVDLVAEVLGVDTPTVLGSEVPAREGPNTRLIDLCRALAADTYLSGSGAREYLDVDAFAAAGIEVRFQAFDHPVYAQRYKPFEPFLSVVDLIMNCGRESLSVIRSGRLGAADDRV